MTTKQTGEEAEVTQTSTASHDGHGRLYQSHKPQQRDGNTLKYTTYSYNQDDSISTITDGRGAVTTYTYENTGGTPRRPLVTGIGWTVPSGSNIPDPTDVAFLYDNAGNRTQMTDGLGTVAYIYDSLSQMTSETREFSDTGTGFPDDTAALEYTYTLGGQLASYKLPFFSDLKVSYTFDKRGRLSSAAGTSSVGNVTYASNAAYRAWGVLKGLDYGNGTEMNIGGFNNKLQATEFEVKKDSTQIINKTYQFNSDGSVKFEDDNLDAKFDRSYEYDHLSRMVKGLSGAAARGDTITSANTPYRQIHQYNAFGQRIQSTLRHYSNGGPSDVYTTWLNNRRTTNGNYWQYDNDGNLLYDNGYKAYKYNAAGQLVYTNYENGGDNFPETYEREQEWIGYSGDGAITKVGTMVQDEENGPAVDGDTVYKLRSSALGGQVVYEKGAAFIFAGGEKIASVKEVTYPSNALATNWHHKDPSMTSYRSTDSAGNVVEAGLIPDSARIETDADGNSVLLSAPVYYPTESNNLYESGWTFGSISTGTSVITVQDGVQVPPEYNQGGSQWDRWAFDLLYRSAEQSREIVGFRFKGPDNYDRTFAAGQVSVHLVAGVLLGRFEAFAVYNSNWAINWSMISFHDQRQGAVGRNPLPGFDEKKRETIEKALDRAKKMLKGSECKKALSEAGIDIENLTKRIETLRPRPASSSTTSGYNIFDAERSTDQQLQRFLKTERGKGAGAFIYG